MLKMAHSSFSKGQFDKKGVNDPMAHSRLNTEIRMLLQKQSDLGLHCLSWLFSSKF